MPDRVEDLPAWMQGPAFRTPTPPAEMPAAFFFRVQFMRLPGQSGAEVASFQEVSGLEHTLETEDVPEGGQNGFVHQLPTRAKPRRLQLKRGLLARGAGFVTWCRDNLQNGLDVPLALIDVQVQLIDTKLNPLMTWTCGNAYPVRWTIDPFESQRNEVALEQIELAYQTLVSPS
jgi:phage tail-like protein